MLAPRFVTPRALLACKMLCATNSGKPLCTESWAWGGHASTQHDSMSRLAAK